MRSQFEEKEYETAVLGELVSTSSFFRSAGQVLEGIVGYDASGSPDPDHVIWRILAVARPAGVRLVPDMWRPLPQPKASRLPSQPVSLLLQFKVPEYLSTANAAQWWYWEKPYFRFGITQRQQYVLQHLQRRLRSDAIVRYASPAFFEATEFEVSYYSRRLVSRTGFVAPSRLSGHEAWTYLGPGLKGFANPHRRAAVFENLEQILHPLFQLQERAMVRVTDEGAARHLARLAAKLFDATDSPALGAALREYRARLSMADTGASRLILDEVAALASIVTASRRLGIGWCLAGYA